MVRSRLLDARATLASHGLDASGDRFNEEVGSHGRAAECPASGVGRGQIEQASGQLAEADCIGVGGPNRRSEFWIRRPRVLSQLELGLECGDRRPQIM